MTFASPFDRLALDWDALHGPDSPNARRYRDRIEYLRALCLRRRPRRVLEIGCGTGLNLFGIADVVSEGWGVDGSAAMIERAQEKAAPRLQFIARDALALSPHELGRFDLVMFIGTLEHIADRAAALRAARAVLAPGGCVLAIMPHPWQPQQMLAGRPRVDGMSIATWQMSPWRLRQIAILSDLALNALWSLSPLNRRSAFRPLPLGRSGSLRAASGQAYAAEFCALPVD